MTDEVVTRLYRALVEELQRRGHPEGQPVKVSELYQDLVPYRAVRSALGVELNADYEHALLRLLSGERDLLRLEPQQAREELRREVEAPYPFVGLFRKFSASNVWVSMPAQDRAAEPAEAENPSDADAAAEAEPTASAGAVDDGGPRTRDTAPPSSPARPSQSPEPRLAAEGRTEPMAGGAAAERAPVRLHAEAPSADPSSRMTHANQPCVFCAEGLPEGRRVRFCPHCGGDQRLQPCPRCDAVLERGWRYCISCGHEVAGP